MAARSEIGPKAKMETASLWRNGSTLRYWILNHDIAQSLRDSLRITLESNWERYANIKFADVDIDKASGAHFHVQFGAAFSNSFVGEAHAPRVVRFAFPPNPSGGTGIDSREVKRVFLHEWAHVLGLEHEHQRPCSPIKFDLALLRHRVAHRKSGWVKALKIDYLRIRGDSLVWWDCFPYDVHSITHYSLYALGLKDQGSTSTCTSKNYELSDKDKALVAYLYPKPSGGTITIDHVQGPQLARQAFPTVRKFRPQVLVGMSALEICLSRPVLDLGISPINVDENGFGFQYVCSPGDTQTGKVLKVQYLVVDPCIEEIHFADPLIKDISGQSSLTQESKRILRGSSGKSLKCIAWIKRLQITVQEIPIKGHVWLSTVDSLPVVGLRGAITGVIYNWLAFSSDAINIAGGSSRLDLDRNRITIPKKIFPERPQVLVGISGLSLTRSTIDDHGCNIAIEIKIEDDSDSDFDDESDWVFSLDQYLCHLGCISDVEVSWVAVSKEYTSETRPMPPEDMEALVREMEEKDKDQEAELERVGQMSDAELKAHDLQKKAERNG